MFEFYLAGIIVAIVILFSMNKNTSKLKDVAQILILATLSWIVIIIMVIYMIGIMVIEAHKRLTSES